MAPGWLEIVAWVSIATGFVTAAAILIDIYVSGRRQVMRVMEAVWPITALYLGPLGWLAYSRLGRPLRDSRASAATVMASLRDGAMAEDAMPYGPMQGEQELPGWRGVAVTATHCGAGCAVGDVIGEWLVFAAAITIAGYTLWAEYIIDFALGYVFGIAFQYWTIKPMSDLTPRTALRRAITADTLSIVAFEGGMFAWMALFQRVLFPRLMTNDPSYWLMMQIAMVIGLLATYPAQVWLINRGVKERMGRPACPAVARGCVPLTTAVR